MSNSIRLTSVNGIPKFRFMKYSFDVSATYSYTKGFFGLERNLTKVPADQSNGTQSKLEQ